MRSPFDWKLMVGSLALLATFVLALPGVKAVRADGAPDAAREQRRSHVQPAGPGGRSRTGRCRPSSRSASRSPPRSIPPTRPDRRPEQPRLQLRHRQPARPRRPSISSACAPSSRPRPDSRRGRRSRPPDFARLRLAARSPALPPGSAALVACGGCPERNEPHLHPADAALDGVSCDRLGAARDLLVDRGVALAAGRPQPPLLGFAARRPGRDRVGRRLGGRGGREPRRQHPRSQRRPLSAISSARAVDWLRAGVPNVYLLEKRDGRRITVTLAAGSVRRDARADRVRCSTRSLLVVAMIYLVTGGAVWWMRPDRAGAWALLLFCSTMSVQLATVIQTDYIAWSFPRLMVNLPLIGATTFHLFTSYPIEPDWIVRHRRIQVLPYLAAVVLGWFAIADHMLGMRAGTGSSLALAYTLGLFLVSLGDRRHRAPPAPRRRAARSRRRGLPGRGGELPARGRGARRGDPVPDVVPVLPAAALGLRVPARRRLRDREAPALRGAQPREVVGRLRRRDARHHRRLRLRHHLRGHARRALRRERAARAGGAALRRDPALQSRCATACRRSSTASSTAIAPPTGWRCARSPRRWSRCCRSARSRIASSWR